MVAALPHVSGGVSMVLSINHDIEASSPREWGCFLHRGCRSEPGRLFPTCVGVFPKSQTIKRGGAISSPHAWGCFLPWRSHSDHGQLFPTCVGVFLFHTSEYRKNTALPHVSGGVSAIMHEVHTATTSSPREWGCFYPCRACKYTYRLFPT